jgi:hypothetical protein
MSGHIMSSMKQSCQSPAGKSLNSQPDEEKDDFRPIDEKDVLSYARQIALGMVSMLETYWGKFTLLYILLSRLFVLAHDSCNLF